jgi:hypothetical protein
VLISGAIGVAVLAVPALSGRFGVVPMEAGQLAAALALALVPFAALVTFKALRTARASVGTTDEDRANDRLAADSEAP